MFTLLMEIIGTYSNYIYDCIYGQSKQLSSLKFLNSPENFENKIKDTKSSEDIFNIQTKEYIHNGNKFTYEYDNEHGNTIEFINTFHKKSICG